MKSGNAVVTNDVGLHARPAAMLVKKAAGFKSNITLSRGFKTVNCKSLLGILSLGAVKGSEVMITAEGEDEEKAVEAIKHFVENLRE